MMRLSNLSKYKKLVLGLILDLIGLLTVFDFIWAPLSGYLMLSMYPQSTGKVAAVIVVIEELVPGFDVFPSFTLMWIYTYWIDKPADTEPQ